MTSDSVLALHGQHALLWAPQWLIGAVASRLVATAVEDRLTFRRNPHTSFAAASDSRTVRVRPRPFDFIKDGVLQLPGPQLRGTATCSTRLLQRPLRGDTAARCTGGFFVSAGGAVAKPGGLAHLARWLAVRGNMMERVDLVPHEAFKRKPKHGTPCNGCGWCCMVT